MLCCAVWDSWKCDFGFTLIHHSMSVTPSDTSTFMAAILVGDVLSLCSVCTQSFSVLLQAPDWAVLRASNCRLISVFLTTDSGWN